MKKILIGVGIAVVLILIIGVSQVRAAGSYSGGIQQVLEGVKQILSGVVQLVQNQPEEGSFGAMPGNELQLPEFTINGVKTWHYRQTMMKATTTTQTAVSRIVCSQLSPAATTTLWYSVRFAVSTTSATGFNLGVGATKYATTSALVTYFPIAANAMLSLVASSTDLGSETLTIKPSQYINASLQGGVGNVSPTGWCNFVFTEL